MKVLKYAGKHADEHYDISTPEKEEAAYRLLFKMLNEEYQCYLDLTETSSDICAPCADGHHIYCRGDADFDCVCSETPDCKHKNISRIHSNQQTGSQRKLYAQALTGNVAAIQKLFKARKCYEYESVKEIEIEDPIVATQERQLWAEEESQESSG
jgi:hypothetical protein